MPARPQTMPIAFFGHGNPMLALQTNAVTATWRTIAQRMPKPRAILCISAHWCTRGTAVTAMAKPRTIHDFGAFPKALFEVQYPAPGSPQLARRVQELLAPIPVRLDQEWGLDHGSWSVLVKAYPDADIPVVQLSLDTSQPSAYHFELGRKLAALREEGVLIIGTGNVVHNLGAMNWSERAPPLDWALRFNDDVRQAIIDDTPRKLCDYEQFGRDAQLSVPSPDHYWPLLYVLGARRRGEAPRFEVDHIEHGSLSMMTVSFGIAGTENTPAEV